MPSEDPEVYHRRVTLDLSCLGVYSLFRSVIMSLSIIPDEGSDLEVSHEGELRRQTLDALKVLGSILLHEGVLSRQEVFDSVYVARKDGLSDVAEALLSLASEERPACVKYIPGSEETPPDRR
jgi:hypothetical protein